MKPTNRLIIVGKAYTGKTSTINRLAHFFQIPKFSSGGYLRDLAVERNIEFDQIRAEAETDGGAIDRLIDGIAREKMRMNTPLIVDGRIPHLFPEAEPFIKILLTCTDPEELLRRAQLRTKNYNLQTNEVVRELSDRNQADVRRFRAYYPELPGIERPFAPQHFDFVIDTNSHRDSNATFRVILDNLSRNTTMVVGALNIL